MRQKSLTRQLEMEQAYEISEKNRSIRNKKKDELQEVMKI